MRWSPRHQKLSPGTEYGKKTKKKKNWLPLLLLPARCAYLIPIKNSFTDAVNRVSARVQKIYKFELITSVVGMLKKKLRSYC